MRHADKLQEFVDSLAQNNAPQSEQMSVELKKLPAREVVISRAIREEIPAWP